MLDEVLARLVELHCLLLAHCSARCSCTGVLAADCAGKCGRSYLQSNNGRYCHCDYFCNNRNDCCGGSASKNALCPDQAPTLVKPQLTNCDLPIRDGSVRSLYRPGMCWCDAFCAQAGDCCASCAVCRPIPKLRKRPDAAAEAAEADEVAQIQAALSPEALEASPLWQKIQAQVQAVTAARQSHEQHDCGAPHNVHELVHAMNRRGSAASTMSAADVAAVAGSLIEAEQQMQACQAADQGPPAQPIKVPLYWTAGQVCDASGCVGGTYSKALVQRQLDLTNAVFAHIGIQFVWDGVIHKATAGDAFEIDVGYGPGDWICNQQRYGDALAVNVMTSPIHPG